MITVAMIPEWEKYESRIFKNGILYVTPEIEFDLTEDPDFYRLASLPQKGRHILKGWEVKRYLSFASGPGNDGDPNGVLRALAWHPNFRQLKDWTFTNDETTTSLDRRLYYNEVLSVTTSLGEENEVNHAVLSAEIDIPSIGSEDLLPVLKKWIREAPEIR